MNIVGDNENNQMPPQNGGIPASALKDAETVKCEACEGTLFEEKMMIKKISKFLTGSDRDSIVPVPVIACSKCGNINDMFKPTI